MPTKVLFHLIIFCLVFSLFGCIAQQSIERTVTVTVFIPTQFSNTLPTELPSIAIITGWFNTIWNGEPHYTLTDELGKEYRLLLDETVTKPLGGALQFDRQKVTVTGNMLNDQTNTLQVISIRLAAPSN